ncbi:MAG: biotin--[acetyl-CoA-carboxylase] ligase, partial [Pseudomonadota bacterium]
MASAGSTNTDAAAWVIAGRSHGVWIRADEQTGGRGRRGRAWHSPVGNLHASVAFRVPTRTSGPPTALPLLAALALLEAVQQVTASQHLRIKWPNDLLLNGKKLAGLLLESASLG